MKIVILILIVVLIAVAVLLTSARLSGWSVLAETYRFLGQFEGQRWRFVSAWMGAKGRLVRFRSCLNVGTNKNGLFLSFFSPFNLIARDVFVPWEDITVNRYEGVLTDYFDFHFRDAPNVTLRLSDSKANEILDSTPRDLPNSDVGD